jgi:hypothetical protein
MDSGIFKEPRQPSDQQVEGLIKRSIPLEVRKRTAAGRGPGQPPKREDPKEIIMTKKLYSMFAMLSLTLMLAVVSVQAQSGRKVEVNVPFDFSLGNKTLPAGAYSIREYSQNSILIASADGKTHVLAMTLGTPQSDVTESALSARLIFRQYGNQYFLAQIWMTTGSDGRELNQSDAERRAAKEQKLASGGQKLKKVEVAARAR